MSEDTDWTQRHATELRNHWWWRPGWHVGTRFYAWHIAFDSAPELHRLADFWQDGLRRFDYLDLIPRQWLHLTMQGVGMVEDVSDETRDRIVDAVRQRLAKLEPVHVTFQRPIARAEAIAMPPDPASAIDAIRHGVRAGMADAIGADFVPEQADGFQPHVSLAYVNREHSASDVIGVIEDTEAPPRASVDIECVSLIKMHRDHQIYEWRIMAEAQIGHDI